MIISFKFEYDEFTERYSKGTIETKNLIIKGTYYESANRFFPHTYQYKNIPSMSAEELLLSIEESEFSKKFRRNFDFDFSINDHIKRIQREQKFNLIGD